MVFYGRPRPANELNEQQLAESLIAARKKQFEAALPSNAAGLETFKSQYGKALKYALMAEYPAADELSTTMKDPPGIRLISRRNQKDLVALQIWRPTRDKRSKQKPLDSYVLIASPESEFVSGSKDLIEQLTKAGHTVAFLNCFPGKNGSEEPSKYKFIATYNRLNDANRIQDILTAVAYLNKVKGNGRLSIIGLKEAGLYAMLAKSYLTGVDQMVVDATQFDNNNDADYLKRVAIPGLNRAGSFATAIAISDFTPLLIHNTGNRFQADKIEQLYRTLGKPENLQVKAEKSPDSAIVTWLTPVAEK